MKDKILIKVPSEVRYISEWDNYEIPFGKCIIDKKVCGCGYTQFCLTNNDNIILCSPRKSLLENKEEQNKDCYYFKSITLSKRDIKLLELKDEKDISNYIYHLQLSKLKIYLDKVYFSRLPIKLLVTYDSLPKLLEMLYQLLEDSIMNSIKIVIDEFQLIFTDARFKADIELDLIDYLDRYCKNVVFLSGTPMLDMYLEQVPMLSNLDYYVLDWNSSRLSEIIINKIRTDNLEKSAIEVINLYRSGNGPIKEVNGKKYKSTEAVLFVNNISMITSIIKTAKLKPEEVNIITAKTPENLRKIKKCGRGFGFGRIPLEGEPCKQFTICTSTAFCGVDFYSENAKAYIFSCCNLKTMAVDISIELPQIAGRQRLDRNIFRKDITMYYSTSINDFSFEDFTKEIESKKKNTRDFIFNYESFQRLENINMEIERKKVRLWAGTMNYTEDYVSVQRSTGFPVFNDLMLLSDIRSWELQNLIYKNDKTVINVLEEVGTIENNPGVSSMLERAVSFSYFDERLKYIHAYIKDHPEDIDLIPEEYRKYLMLDSEYIESSGYNKYAIDRKEARRIPREQILKDQKFISILYETFIVGESYLKSNVKEILNHLSRKLGYEESLKLKASDLENFFEIKQVLITNPETHKRDNAFRILAIKNYDLLN